MEGNRQNSVAAAVPKRRNRRANGVASRVDLAAVNAKLVQENAELTRERDSLIAELERANKSSTDELQKRTSQFSQERLLLRTLIDNLPDCIYAKDLTGRKTLANPADLKNLRCETEADAIGKSDFDFFPQEVAEKFWADDQKVIQGQPVINREEYFLDEEGRQVWLLTSKLPLRDADGEVIGLIGIGRDITQEKRMQTELAYEQELLRALLENSPTRIFFKDRQSGFVRFSNSKAQGTYDAMRR